ncbi:hypothetical protein BLOT_013978 [Blomia tropicalis]|nr:hypothetical protein BLOT_013978 [Blomia tropicalis]
MFAIGDDRDIIYKMFYDLQQNVTFKVEPFKLRFSYLTPRLEVMIIVPLHNASEVNVTFPFLGNVWFRSGKREKLYRE